MGQVTIESIVDEVRLDLVDEDAVTWTDDDLVADLNEAIRWLLLLKPDAYVVTGPINLAAGTIQSLPAGATALFDIAENVASGRRVTQVDLELLDETYRFWPAGTQATDLKHFAFDPRNRTQYRAYPPNDGTGQVTASYGAVPDPVGLSADLLPVGDQYAPPLKLYTMAVAYRRNTQRQDLAKAQGYTQQAMTMLGLGSQAANAVTPKVNTSPGAA